MNPDREFLSRLKSANAEEGPDVFGPARPTENRARHPAPPGSKISPVPATYDRRQVGPPRGWGYWLLLIAVALFAYGVGSWTHSTDIPERRTSPALGDAPVQTVTVTVTKEVTKAVPQMPQACTEALQLAIDLSKETPTIINSGGRTTDLLKEARIAITEQNHQKLNSIGTQINTLKNNTSASTQHILELQDRFAAKLNDCNHALGR